LIRPREDLPPVAAESPAVASAAPGASGWNLERLPPELEYFRTSSSYQVELAAFAGPLDLLLYLIQKDQIDIYDIPVASITDQFLRHLEVIQLLQLDNAGDFLVMAATLLRLKTRMLLPAQAEEDLEEEDPRAELVRRLLEYKRFKEAAAAFREREKERRRYHVRCGRYPFLDEERLEPPLRIGMFELLSALAGVFDRLTAPPVHAVRREPYTVEQKIELIRQRLQASALVLFEDLFATDTIKMEVVVTFIAILELVKRGELMLIQTEIHGPIWLRPAGTQDEGPRGGELRAAEARA
jgi:segregation and condensation protein A